MKKDKKELLYNFINGGGVTAIIALVAIIIAFIYAKVSEESLQIMDWTILTSIVIAMALEIASKAISRYWLNRLEDDVKLTADYESLSKKYMNEKVTYDNSLSAQENIQKYLEKYPVKQGENINYEVTIPVVCDAELYDCTIEIDDTEVDETYDYNLPEEVDQRFDEIFAAHMTSKIYNQVSIRIQDWHMDPEDSKKFVVKTGRTTYFKSMVTNRAMDYRWKNGLTVREMYECGPYLNPLRKSSLSNHIGFNGFLESQDGYVVFVKRKDDMSIGKRTYGNSVGAALKAKYALNADGIFNVKGLLNGVEKEFADELKVRNIKADDGLTIIEKEIEELSVNNIIAAYRDLVEGGKPQFLVVVKSTLSKQKIEENFIDRCKKSNKNVVDEMLEDGDKLLWIKKADLEKICILPNGMIYQGVEYPMMPSAVASLVMYINYLKKGN